MKKIKCLRLLVLCFVFIGLMIIPLLYGQDVKAAASAPELVWVYPGSGVQKDIAKVTAEINKYIEPKIGAKVKLVCVNWEKWGNKPNYDITFTANWWNYFQEADKGTFLALEGYSTTALKNTYKLLGSGLIKAATRNGHLYALPVAGDNVCIAGVKLRKDLVTKYKINTSTIKSLKDLESALRKVKSGEKLTRVMEVCNDNLASFFGMDSLGSPNIPGVIYGNSVDMAVFNLFGSDKAMSFFKTLNGFSKAGLIYKAKNNDEIKSDEYNGRCFAILKGSMYFYDDRDANSKKGLEWVNIALSTPVRNTVDATTQMNAISAKSSHPEQAAKLLELVNTDAYLNNLINFGIEKVHYVKTKDGRITFPKGVNAANSKYYPNTQWNFGNEYLNFIWTYRDPNITKARKDLNNKAVNSKALGFYFDQKPVQSMINACTAVYNKYLPDLFSGKADPAKILPELNSKLEAAGMENIVIEKQNQLDTWLKKQQSAGQGTTVQASPSLDQYYTLLMVAAGREVLLRNDGISRIAFGNSKFVDIDGKVSTNGINWVKNSSFSFNFPREIAFGKGRFVIAGNGGITYSDDGQKWQMCTFPDSLKDTRFNGVCFDGRKFAAAGNEGTIAWSEDGVEWRFASGYKGTSLSSITAGKDMYIAGDNNGGISYSSDADNWKASTLPEFDDRGQVVVYDASTLWIVNNISYNGTLFAAQVGQHSTSGKVGEYYTQISTDGIKWTRLADTEDNRQNRFTILGCFKGCFIVRFFNGEISYTSDFKEWKKLKESEWDRAEVVIVINYDGSSKAYTFE